MSEEEIKLFEEKLKSIPCNIDNPLTPVKIVGVKPPITSMDSIDINEIINVVKRFKCMPSKSILIETNNSLSWQVENLEKKLNKYKSVLDEIREYIKEHNDYLEKAKEMYIDCNDELLKSTCIQLINNELVRSDNLLQILDKVKENV